MKRRAKTREGILAVLMVLFCIQVLWVLRLAPIPFPMMAVLSLGFGLLGILLVLLSMDREEPRVQKGLTIVAGASAAGIPLSVLLHNALYVLCIRWFGSEIWGPDGDEAVCFILALFVFPALFLVSSVAAWFWIFKAKRQNPRPPAS